MGVIRNTMKNQEVKIENGFRAVLRSVLDIGGTVLISVAAVIVIRTYVVQPFLVSGESMVPNFADGNGARLLFLNTPAIPKPFM